MFSDLERNCDVVCLEVHYPDSDRTALIIAPPEDVYAIQAAINNFYAGDVDSPIPVDNMIVHFHIDTVAVYEEPNSLATLETYVDPKTGLIYGRGPGDMKGTAALASLLARLSVDRGVKPPVFIITADEEIHGELGGLQLLRSMKSTRLTIDWEPIASHPGTYVDAILPGLTVGVSVLDPVYLADLIKLQTKLNEQFTKSMCLPHVTLSDNKVLLSINTHHLKDTDNKLMSHLLAIAHWAGFIPSGEVTCYTSSSKGNLAQISPAKKKIITESLRKNFPWQPSKRTVSHLSSSEVDMLARLNRHAVYSGNIDTLVFKANPNGTDVVDIGTDESGGGRHSATEAVQVDQLISLLYTTLQIHTELATLN
jgi:hypothetical protein